jgi:hypothetical protein
VRDRYFFHIRDLLGVTLATPVMFAPEEVDRRYP